MKKIGDKTSSNINTPPLEEDKKNIIIQNYSDLNSCFGMESSLSIEQLPYYLIAGEELATTDIYFFQLTENNFCLIDAFRFRLAEDQDTIILDNICSINGVFYDRIEFQKLKNLKLQKKDVSILSSFKHMESDSHLGRFDPFL
ncbi:MAG: hypothetical protein IPJ74_08505 [Saprospiraceae bacterium]|nr:hypothetical protein [Saprospiraceae bacterium]